MDEPVPFCRPVQILVGPLEVAGVMPVVVVRDMGRRVSVVALTVDNLSHELNSVIVSGLSFSVRGAHQSCNASLLRVPAGTGRFYKCVSLGGQDEILRLPSIAEEKFSLQVLYG